MPPAKEWQGRRVSEEDRSLMMIYLPPVWTQKSCIMAGKKAISSFRF